MKATGRDGDDNKNPQRKTHIPQIRLHPTELGRLPPPILLSALSAQHHLLPLPLSKTSSVQTACTPRLCLPKISSVQTASTPRLCLPCFFFFVVCFVGCV